MQQCREDVHEDSSYQPAIYHRQILHWNLSHRHQDSSQDYTENVYDLQLVDIPSEVSSRPKCSKFSKKIRLH